MLNAVIPAGNLLTTDDTDRGRSRHIWHDCPIAVLKSDNSKGIFFEDDFTTLPKTPATTEGNFGPYAQFSSSGGTINAGTGQGGEWVLGEATDDEGVSFRTRATPFKLARTTKKFWMEARVKRSTIADTTAGIFVGLTDDVALTAISPIAAAGTLADLNLIGFHFTEGDGDQFSTVLRANGQTAVTVQDDAANTAMVADTYTKIGMVFEPDYDLYTGSAYLVTFFQNGRRTGTTSTYQVPSADGNPFPNDVGLGLTMAILLAATAAFTATIDWWAAAQLYY